MLMLTSSRCSSIAVIMWVEVRDPLVEPVEDVSGSDGRLGGGPEHQALRGALGVLR